MQVVDRAAQRADAARTARAGATEHTDRDLAVTHDSRVVAVAGPAGIERALEVRHARREDRVAGAARALRVDRARGTVVGTAAALRAVRAVGVDRAEAAFVGAD